MKTILITDFHPFVSRNILATGVFEMLARTSGVRVVIACPEKKRAFFEREYARANVFIHGVPGRIRRRDAFFKDLAMAAVRTRSLSLMRKMRIGFERAWLVRLLTPVAPLLRPFIPFWYRMCMPWRAYADIFEKWSPTLVFATDIFGSADCRIAHEARGRGITVVGMVRSWDNLTTKGGFRFIPDVLLVNNNIIKREAVDIHRIPERIIHVVGLPHYDRYACSSYNALRDTYAAKGKRLILYAPLGDRIIKVGDGKMGQGYDDRMIRLLARIIPDSHILFVRLPPTDEVSFSAEPLPPNVVVERPGTSFGGNAKAIKVTELTRADDARLVETLCGSDIVLTVFSSIAVDALVLGKPVVLLGFDPVLVPYWQSAARLHELDHIRELIDAGVPAVYDADTLRVQMMRILANPSADVSARERAALAQMFSRDGRSSERLWEVVWEAMH